VLNAFAAIDPKAREVPEADLHALLAEFNVAKDGALIAPSEYLKLSSRTDPGARVGRGANATPRPWAADP
jgi:hypothetical protein